MLAAPPRAGGPSFYSSAELSALPLLLRFSRLRPMLLILVAFGGGRGLARRVFAVAGAILVPHDVRSQASPLGHRPVWKRSQISLERTMVSLTFLFVQTDAVLAVQREESPQWCQ